jgi:hypothetical protein
MEKEDVRGASQTFHGAVHGYVAGRDLHVHARPARRSWWDMERAELLRQRTRAQQQIKDARRRMLVNWPVALFALLMSGGTLTVLFNLKLGLWAFTHPGAERPSIDPALFIAALVAYMLGTTICVEWVNRVQRPERAVIRSARHDIDQIEVVLRRRDW